MALLPYSLPKSVLFKMDPEAAHELTMAGLARFQNTPLACLWGSRARQ
jgi:dihydroorotate dehydrogenase